MSNEFAIYIEDEESGETKLLYEPTDKQKEFHATTEPNVLYVGARGTGKAVALDTEIPTTEGFVPMRDIRVGDQVFDEQGQPCSVVWKSDVHTDPLGTFKVVFDDETVVVCGGNHEWVTRTKYEEGKGLASVKTTVQIAESLKAGARETNHRIPLSHAWNLEQRSFPIDPYVLGVWLGDGSKGTGEITSLDIEIVQEISACGYRVEPMKAPYKWQVYGLVTQLRALDAKERTTATHGLCARCQQQRWLKARRLCAHCYGSSDRAQFNKAHKGFKRFADGVINRKRIPLEYLLGSTAQRLALLQGLMDTDGYCDPRQGSVEFCNTNKNLAEGVYQLATSLGLKATLHEGRARLNGRDCGPKYRVCWTATLPVFRLPRKLVNLPKHVRSTQHKRYIVSVERVDDVHVQCIEVDSPSHVYQITRSCVATHNSHALRWEAHARALAYPGFKYVILRRTSPELLRSHLLFIDAEMKALGGDWHGTHKMARYANGSVGFYSHCESEADVLNLLSAEFYWMGFDEMSTFPWEMITKLSASVRVPKGSGLIAMVRGATNPLGESASDLNRYYLLKDIEAEEDPEYVPDDYKAIQTYMGDNPHIDVEQYVKRFAGMPEHVKKAWLEGEFLPERMLFEVRKFKDGKPWHIITELPTWSDGTSILKQPWVRIYRAFDNGYFPDPAVCIWFAVIGKRIIAFKEKMYIKTIAKDIAEDIVKESEGMRVAATFCDPTLDMKTTADVKTIRDVMEDAGVPMECSVNNREFFAHAINSALKEEVDGLPRFQMYVPGGPMGSPFLAKYLPQMKYDEKNPMAMADHKHDHYAVCLAYFLMSFIPTTKQHINVEIPFWMRPKSRNALGSKQVKGRYQQHVQ